MPADNASLKLISDDSAKKIADALTKETAPATSGTNQTFKSTAGPLVPPVEEAKKTIHLREPAKMSGNCMQCHSTEDALWLKVSDHQASVGDVRAGRISCASAGCHGPAHPFSKSNGPIP